MTPNPHPVITDQSSPVDEPSSELAGDEVVISGIAGAFPKSENTWEFMENLYNKVDMVGEVECSAVKHPSMPRCLGKVHNKDKFDAQFFRVTHWQASSLDPMSRKIMEYAYAAIYDAGVNPVTLAGTKLGVYVGSSYSDIATINLYNSVNQNSFVISGCSKTMLANRISYWINGKGPSYGLDHSCSSFMTCLELAYQGMNRGDCDAALVGGCNACAHPMLTLNLKMAGHLCLDGKTKCFDKNGDGYVRSEAVSVIFLQKARDAKRIYTQVYHVKGKYFMGPDENFLGIRNSEDIQKFYEEFYSEIKLDPSQVDYIEAHGSGIAVGDGNELDAIGNFFAKSKSIRVGSIKSNMGHAEAASGACAVTKMCLAYQRGKLPSNLHYQEPPKHIPAIRDGRIQVLTDNVSFNRGFTAVNSFSYVGGNHHVLLKGYHKEKKYQRLIDFPYLILASGRDEQGVHSIFDKLKSQSIHSEQIALLHNIYKHNIPGHTGRGYTILDTNTEGENDSLARGFEFYSGSSRPVWFLYSGMGSQWAEMGKELLRIPVFAAAIERCRKVLEPVGVDIVKIITEPDKSIFDSILNSMVGISAIQIGLTDILKTIGIVPDHIIGHSIGELGCAYADECFTAEEMILASYRRGLVSIQTPFIRGAMAAIGLGYNDILPLCPPEIEIACHNSAESSTISGPVEIMKEFLAKLTAQGIFAREVPCGNIAYHSKYIAAAGPALFAVMQDLIPNPKQRSEKWISTSVPQEMWNQTRAKYASAEYFTNNLLSPVYFEENSIFIPDDAIVIEIAPHGLLQAIVKRSHTECINIALTKRGCPDPVTFLFEGIGKLYQAGLNPHIDRMYPKVDFPVSIDTPLLSHLVTWDHSVEWPSLIHTTKEAKTGSSRNVAISLYDDDHKYLEGHIRNGINEFPETALLVLTWETLAMHNGMSYKDMSVVFYDINFHRQLKIDANDVLRLRIMIQHGSGQFKIIHGETAIVTGIVNKLGKKFRVRAVTDISDDSDYIHEEDVYTLFRMKDYSYRNDFRSIHSINIKEGKANIKWTGQWTSFLDSLIQLNAFVRDHDGVSKPKIINRLIIDLNEHKMDNQVNLDDVNCYKAQFSKLHDRARCAGVEIDGMIYDDITKIEQVPDVLAEKLFIPHLSENNTNLFNALLVNLQIIGDNTGEETLKITEIVSPKAMSIIDVLKDLSSKYYLKNLDCNSMSMENINMNTKTKIAKTKLFIMLNFLQDQKVIKFIYENMENDNFVLASQNILNADIMKNNIEIISKISVDSHTLVLLKKLENIENENIIYIPIQHDESFSWLPHVQNELQKTRRVVLVSEKQPYCGLLGLVKYLKQNKHNKIGLVVIDDYSAPSFSPEKDIYKNQMQKNMTFNILKKSQWGGYYYRPCEKSLKKSDISLTSTTFRDLNNFIWMGCPESDMHKNSVKVSYAGLSLKDCERAVGQINDGSRFFGYDFSGIDKRGQRVMGLVASGTVASKVEADPTLLWPVPAHWNLGEAATVPLPFVHAYYCLVVRNTLSSIKTVLVIGGSGGIGQAMISVCLNLNYTVFTTVSNVSKKSLLTKLFPNLKGSPHLLPRVPWEPAKGLSWKWAAAFPVYFYHKLLRSPRRLPSAVFLGEAYVQQWTEENVFYSRHDLFYALISDATKNKKCDLVINCSNGKLQEAAIKCVAFQGVMMDLSDVDMIENNKFGMNCIETINYQVVNLSNLFRAEKIYERKMLQRIIAEGISKGVVRPLSRVEYLPQDISRAFRLLSSSRHRGRVLIKMENNKETNMNIMPRMNYSEGIYVVVCDENNIGIELIDHLIKKGAEIIIINLKHNYSSTYLYAKAISWQKLNVNLEIYSENLQTKEGCEKLLKIAQAKGAVNGIFVVQDYKEKVDTNILERNDFKQSYIDFTLATRNLDIASRNVCTKLRHFVILSVFEQSISNYYATAACEKICEARKELGLPALVLFTERPEGQCYENLLLTLGMKNLSSLFSAMDISLKLKHGNIIAKNLMKRHNSDSIISHIEKIIGVKSILKIDENLTLDQLSVSHINLEEIKIALSPAIYSTEELKEMSIASLKNLHWNSKIQDINTRNGLGAFYTYVEKDDYVATETFIPMKTLLSSFEGDGLIDRFEPHLLMLPGFEGHHRIFSSVAERLKIQAMTLQLGPDVMGESIPDIAYSLKEHIKSNFQISEKFYLLGYSFGVNVALEVAKLLELDGYIGIVYCLDSSPDALKLQMKACTGDVDDKELQNAVVKHIYYLATGEESKELEHNLELTEDWTKKIELYVNELQGKVTFSMEYKRALVEAAYKRIKLAQEYMPNFKLDSQLVLMKGKRHQNVTDQLSSDYNLSKYTKQPVRVFNIDSDNTMAPYDCNVSNIINKMLDQNLLEEFKRKNLCDVYYL